MARKPGRTKQRMLDSAVTLLRERGTAGVTIDAVLAHSGAPRGSVYFHFPGGRTELIISAARRAGDYVELLINEATKNGDPRQALERFVEFWKQSLRDTGYLAGCPIAALAVDSRQDSPEIADLVRDTFTRWQRQLRELLVTSGIPAERAQRMCTLAVASIEGAIILCRAHRDVTPLDDVLAELTPVFEDR